MDVNIRGPLWEGRAHDIIAAATQDGQNAVSNEAVNRVHERLSTVLRHPTGYYESHIVTDRAKASNVVSDSGVIYGPWLEGVGSRNKTTRFKGYFTFRTVGQGLQQDAGRIAEEGMTPKLRELNR